MGADDVVAKSYNQLEKNRVICIPGFINGILYSVMRCPPLLYLARGAKYSIKRVSGFVAGIRAAL
jgi:hypothetical protein